MTHTTTHLEALRVGLSHEAARLEAVKAARAEYKGKSARKIEAIDMEISLRTVWVSQYEKEIAGEIAFLEARGVTVPSILSLDDILADMDDDELLSELFK